MDVPLRNLSFRQGTARSLGGSFSSEIRGVAGDFADISGRNSDHPSLALADTLSDELKGG